MAGRSRSRLRDWLFSGHGKHRLLDQLLVEHPGREWTRKELATAAEQHEKARMDKYAGPLIQIGLLVRVGHAYRVDDAHPLADPLRTLLRTLRQVPDDPIER